MSIFDPKADAAALKPLLDSETDKLVAALDRFTNVLERFLDYTVTIKVEKNSQ